VVTGVDSWVIDGAVGTAEEVNGESLALVLIPVNAAVKAGAVGIVGIITSHGAVHLGGLRIHGRAVRRSSGG